MSTPSPRTVVESYFSALSEGRVADALALFSPTAVWHQPGQNRFSGQHVGPDAVRVLIGTMMETSGGTLAVSPAGPAMDNGALVAVPVRFTGRRDGRVLDQTGVDLLTVRDGAIVEVRLFSSDGPAEDAFWGRA